MKLYKLNKNILHNGKTYAKDSFIKESDDGFKSIVANGHCEIISDEVKAAVEPKSEDEPVQQEKPARKSGK
jgi:hypothetical protein